MFNSRSLKLINTAEVQVTDFESPRRVQGRDRVFGDRTIGTFLVRVLVPRLVREPKVEAGGSLMVIDP